MDAIVDIEMILNLHDVPDWMVHDVERQTWASIPQHGVTFNECMAKCREMGPNRFAPHLSSLGLTFLTTESILTTRTEHFGTLMDLLKAQAEGYAKEMGSDVYVKSLEIVGTNFEIRGAIVNVKTKVTFDMK